MGSLFKSSGSTPKGGLGVYAVGMQFDGSDFMVAQELEAQVIAESPADARKKGEAIVEEFAKKLRESGKEIRIAQVIDLAFARPLTAEELAQRQT